MATKTLGEFEGLDVTKTTIEIPNASGGLNEGLKIEPMFLKTHDTVYVVLECNVVDVGFDARKAPEGETYRYHVLKATGAAIVEGSLVAEAIRQQKEKLRLAREAAEGIQRLPVPEDLANDHDLGGHGQALVPGCPKCQAEIDATEAETKSRKRAKSAPTD